MNRDESLNVVAMLMSGWPTHDWPDATVELWLGDLNHWSFEEAETAFGACRRSCDWSPPWSQFLNALTDARRSLGREIHVAEIGPMGQVVAPPDLSLKGKKRQEHWHGGPKPCPVCGGIRPEHLGRARRPA